MGFLKNATRAVGREAKKSARKTAYKIGNKLFGETYKKATKTRRTAGRGRR